MTNYGAIPTSSHASPELDLESISQENQCKPATRRPWRVMFDFHSMGLPRGVSDVFSRYDKNVEYFRLNYVIVVSIIISIAVFVNLIKYPIALIVYTVWIFLWICYFLRDEPNKLFGYAINDRGVSICLGLIGVPLVKLTNDMYSICLPLFTGSVLVLIHSVVRKTEDLFLDLDQEEATTETSS
ncbi:unnamed protein product [Microthlaspi erraticum]|uniref:PRA1 family protein n=1 Tax=Microthlaspi erraticum TaxID=1685480 RepID=A0A6D2HLF9_9BRAS|nr:unnamed protein product [Microthlaspi erraticum]